MGFRSVYPDSVLTPHLALLNPIAMLIDRWMALMFALGWIPALGSNLGRFMWEVSPMSLGGQNLGTMLGRYGFRLPESAADWMIFECIFIKLCWRFFRLSGSGRSGSWNDRCVIHLHSWVVKNANTWDGFTPFERLKNHWWTTPLFQNMGGKYDQWYTSKVTEGEALRFPLVDFKPLEFIESTEMVTLEAFFILFPSFSLWPIWPRYEDAELRHYGWPAPHHAPILDTDGASSARSCFGHQTEQPRHQRDPGRDKSGASRFEVQHETTWSSKKNSLSSYYWVERDKPSDIMVIQFQYIF